MQKLSTPLQLFLNLAKVQAVMSRRFDARLGGLGFSEFMILYYLSNAPEQKMRRIDLAEKIGLTASGVTRILLPMEKIGLVKKQVDPRDARVSFVLLATGGKAQLVEGIDRAELLAEDIVPAGKQKKLEELSELFLAITEAAK